MQAATLIKIIKSSVSCQNSSPGVVNTHSYSLRRTFWFSVAYIGAAEVQIYKKCSQQNSKNRNNKSCDRIFFSCLFHHASFIFFTAAQQASRDETDKRNDLNNPHISDIKRSLLRKIGVSKGSLYCGINFKHSFHKISHQRGARQNVKRQYEDT